MISKLYKEMQQDGKKHLVLARLFSAAFSRRLRTTEWGFFRKLLNLYGADILFWALLSSAHLTDTTSPLSYVSKVCSNMSREILERPQTTTYIETQKRLAEIKELLTIFGGGHGNTA